MLSQSSSVPRKDLCNIQRFPVRGAAAQSAESLASPRLTPSLVLPWHGCPGAWGDGGIGGWGRVRGQLRPRLAGWRRAPSPAPVHPKDAPGRPPRAPPAPPTRYRPPSGCGRNSSERGTCPRSHAGDPEEGKEGWGRRENLAVQSEGRFRKRLASKENEGDAWQR